jgi:hypothetical protein
MIFLLSRGSAGTVTGIQAWVRTHNLTRQVGKRNHEESEINCERYCLLCHFSWDYRWRTFCREWFGGNQAGYGITGLMSRPAHSRRRNVMYARRPRLLN